MTRVTGLLILFLESESIGSSPNAPDRATDRPVLANVKNVSSTKKTFRKRGKKKSPNYKERK